MKISVLCSSTHHPIFQLLKGWCDRCGQYHDVQLVTDKKLLSGGDILFLISCAEIIGKEIRDKYQSTLVIHASDLPSGRGWSPLVWQIIEGKSDIAVTLLEANEKVDSGPIWARIILQFEGHELFDEINQALFEAEFELMDFAVHGVNSITPQIQPDVAATYYRKRVPEDSRIDPGKSIVEQFNLLRVADPERYPAFFDHLGHRYIIKLVKTGRINNGK